MTTYKREVRQRTAHENHFPHQWIGIITFSDESARGQQLIASFVESVWSKFLGTEDIAVSQVFGVTETSLLISSKTMKLADELVDETVNRLKEGFKSSGELLKLAS